MNEEELTTDFLSEGLLISTLDLTRDDRVLEPEISQKLENRHRMSLAVIDQCMSQITVANVFFQPFSQRLFAVKLMWHAFARGDIGIPPPAPTEERENMSMPEVKNVKIENEEELQNNGLFEGLKNSVVVMFAAYLKRKRLETDKQMVGLAAFIVHFLTLQEYRELEVKDRKAVRHVFSYETYTLPEAAVTAVNNQLKLLETAKVVDYGVLESYMDENHDLYLQTVNKFVWMVYESLPASFLYSDQNRIIERSVDRHVI